MSSLLVTVASVALLFGGTSAYATEALEQYRDRIEQAYNARDSAAIEAAIGALIQAGKSGGKEDLASYYAAYGRLRQSAIAGDDKRSARNYLEQCIEELEALLERRPDIARARALYASCLGASANYYVLRAATRGIAAGREIDAARKLAPDDPWVVFQDGISDFMMPAMFGGNRERALAKLKRAEQLMVASRPPDSTRPVFGEADVWLYIGRIYLSTDREDLARDAWEKALSLAPDSTDVREELAKL